MLGLLPFNLFYFGSVSVISPIANLIVVPIFSFIIIPLSLVGVALIFFIPKLAKLLLIIAHYVFEYAWNVLKILNNYSYLNVELFKSDIFVSFLLFIGALWLLSGKGVPGKKLVLIFLLPILFPTPEKINYGEFKFTMLDVGQGLSCVVQTKNHVLVYDTGPKQGENLDLGSQAVIPYLKNQYIKKIDSIMISHPDLDHIGGLDSILNNNFKINKLIINDPNSLKKYKSKYTIEPCLAGQKWEWDEVKFETLYPEKTVINSKNEYSCVLKISNKNHSILLTGDIGIEQEDDLIKKYNNNKKYKNNKKHKINNRSKSKLKSDILIVPHHGSKYSSSFDFIKAVDPKYALISAGYLNQYSHPSQDIVERYKNNNSEIFVSNKTGAVTVYSVNKNLKMLINRSNYLKYLF